MLSKASSSGLEERLGAVIAAKAEAMVTGVRPGREQEKMKDCEELARMPLESLLYYVLVGEGSRSDRFTRRGRVRQDSF